MECQLPGNPTADTPILYESDRATSIARSKPVSARRWRSVVVGGDDDDIAAIAPGTTGGAEQHSEGGVVEGVDAVQVDGNRHCRVVEDRRR